MPLKFGWVRNCVTLYHRAVELEVMPAALSAAPAITLRSAPLALRYRLPLASNAISRPESWVVISVNTTWLIEAKAAAGLRTSNTVSAFGVAKPLESAQT